MGPGLWDRSSYMRPTRYIGPIGDWRYMGPLKLYGTNQGFWDRSRFMGPIKVYKTIRVFETTGGILEV